jgi:hypothetical protein
MALLILGSQTAFGQSSASLQGAVLDEQGAVVVGATVTVKHLATGLERSATTDDRGNFLIAALPAGNYRIEIRKNGFHTLVVGTYTLAVDTTAAQNFTLTVGEVSLTVEVSSDAPMIESSTMTVGQVINQKTVQEIPLNGRHFVDLGLLIPGSVTPPQSGFLTAPLRGQGSFGLNTAGQREDTVNFMINGINLNDMVQNQITFQPSINTVSEFKVDNSTYSAEYGRNSGAIVNIATRSGSNQFHGEAFEFVRNEDLDARNFFNPVTSLTGAPLAKNPFKRNQFGGAVGGPIWKDHTFFFFSYEGLRQRQRIDINGGVLGDSSFPRAGVDERAQAQTTGNPTVVKLLSLIPNPNSRDANGNPVFLGGAVAPVNIDQWTGDISNNKGQNDRLHGYYVFQRDRRREPTLQGNTIPGFGDTRQSHRQIFTLNEIHIFSPTLVNEARLGFNRIHITFTPNAQLNPVDFSINDGVTSPLGLPQITIQNIGLNFGGPSGFPQGRGDTTGVFSDTLNWQRGRHGLKFGGEVRRFYNNNFNLDIGTFRFSSTKTGVAGAAESVQNFINGKASRFTITLGNGASKIVESAFGFFAQNSIRVWPSFTLELGLRYDDNLAPSDSKNRFVVFDPAPVSLVQMSSPYQDNNKNVQPRVGFAWDPFKTGKTSVRGGYAIQYDQPVTNAVTGLTNNPPFGFPFVQTSSSNNITFSPSINTSNPASISPASINPGFHNPYVQSWNLNVDREILPSLGVTVGYFGSKGTHLRISRNINQRGSPNSGQPVPFPRLNSSSTFTCPVPPGTTCPALGIITTVDSASNSSYNALWVTANKRLSQGLQFNASYAFSKSIDENSRSSAEGVIIQDNNNLRGNRGLSEFDVRHRFVINWIYELPFKGNRLVEGWQLSSIAQWQSGNPIAIVLTDPATGLNTLRPDLIGSIQYVNDPTQWFINSVCDPSKTATCPAGSVFAIPAVTSGTSTVFHFGNLGRNVLIGPGFSNIDFSILKNTRITERMRIQFRTEFFNIFNHPNLGQPGRIVGATNFGVIQSTRFPTGDAGSSRQVQFALKLLF